MRRKREFWETNYAIHVMFHVKSHTAYVLLLRMAKILEDILNTIMKESDKRLLFLQRRIPKWSFQISQQFIQIYLFWNLC